mmetsp:Transcript_80057/g.183424  ORF Transcript_80057/g.183424 Transcript_80057/m.183424 type:complete len:238 (+) Transcript_80057:1171-1884(+)
MQLSSRSLRHSFLSTFWSQSYRATALMLSFRESDGSSQIALNSWAQKPTWKIRHGSPRPQGEHQWQKQPSGGAPDVEQTCPQRHRRTRLGRTKGLKTVESSNTRSSKRVWFSPEDHSMRVLRISTIISPTGSTRQIGYRDNAAFCFCQAASSSSSTSTTRPAVAVGIRTEPEAARVPRMYSSIRRSPFVRPTPWADSSEVRSTGSCTVLAGHTSLICSVGRDGNETIHPLTCLPLFS